MDAAAIAAIITGVGGLVTALVTAIISAKKDQLEALQKIVDEVQQENGRLRQELMAEATRNVELRARVDEVEAELKSSRRQMADMECELKQARSQIADLTRENVELRALLAQYRREADCEVTSG
jgi:chromosome segregation ATPase